MYRSYFWLRKSLSCKLLEVGAEFRGDIAICLRCSCALPKLVPGRFQGAEMKPDGLQCPQASALGLCNDLWLSWATTWHLWESSCPCN